jgi:hypothetical protein
MARHLFAYGKAVATPEGTRAILIESRGRDPLPTPEKARDDFRAAYPGLLKVATQAPPRRS